MIKTLDGKYKLEQSDIEIYQNFNVYIQTLDHMNDDERFIILFLCVTKHDKQEIVPFCEPFIKELRKIKDFYNMKAGGTIIDMSFSDFDDMINDMLKELPRPYTKNEATQIRRELNLNNLLDEEV